MKKPNQMDVDNLNYGTNLSFQQGIANGEIYGANDMWEEWNAYHNWDIEEHYIHKNKLPSVEKIRNIIQEIQADMVLEYCNGVLSNTSIYNDDHYYDLTKQLNKRGRKDV